MTCSQFAEILHINAYQMAMCAAPLGAQFAQAFQPDRGCSRGYQAEWKIQDGRLYLIKLAGTLRNGSEATVATFFPNSPDRVFAAWYSGPLVEPDVNRTKYIPGPNCVYDCDLFVTIDKGVVAEAYLSRAGGPKDYAAAAERYGMRAMNNQPAIATQMSEANDAEAGSVGR